MSLRAPALSDGGPRGLELLLGLEPPLCKRCLSCCFCRSSSALGAGSEARLSELMTASTREDIVELDRGVAGKVSTWRLIQNSIPKGSLEIVRFCRVLTRALFVVGLVLKG